MRRKVRSSSGQVAIAKVDSPKQSWLEGGAISLIGALCYAELATTYPHVGGNYYYLIAIFDCMRDTGRGARLCAPTDVYFTQLTTASIYAAGALGEAVAISDREFCDKHMSKEDSSCNYKKYC